MAEGLFKRIWRSKSDEYFLLKLFINTPLGVVLGIGEYRQVKPTRISCHCGTKLISLACIYNIYKLYQCLKYPECTFASVVPPGQSVLVM